MFNMKQNANRPQNDKKNIKPGEDNHSTINGAQHDLGYDINKSSMDDMGSFPNESGSSEDSRSVETEFNDQVTPGVEVDTDGENKEGLESPWNIYS